MIIVSDFLNHNSDELSDRDITNTLNLNNRTLSLDAGQSIRGKKIFVDGISGTGSFTVRVGGTDYTTSIYEDLYLGRHRAIVTIGGTGTTRTFQFRKNVTAGIVRVWDPADEVTDFNAQYGLQARLADRKLQVTLADGSTIEKELDGEPVLKFRVPLALNARIADGDYFADSPSLRALVKVLRGPKELLMIEQRLPWHAYLGLKKTEVVFDVPQFNSIRIQGFEVEVI